MTKTFSDRVVTIVVVKASPEVKMCNTAAECVKVQRVTSLVFKRPNGN